MSTFNCIEDILRDMKIDACDSLSNDLVEKAIDDYQYSNRASLEERMSIYQYRYAKDHGSFGVTVETEPDVLECTLHVSGDDHTVRIPIQKEPTEVEVYPWGDVRFENIELLAVSLRSDYPWTNEAFVPIYWADACLDSNELGDPHPDDTKFIEEKFHILTQYVPPRGVTDEEDVLPEVVGYGEETFSPHMIRQFTHAKTPNPWAKYALMVLYEDEELATRLLTHDNLHMPADQYHRTPPDELHGV